MSTVNKNWIENEISTILKPIDEKYISTLPKATFEAVISIYRNIEINRPDRGFDLPKDVYDRIITSPEFYNKCLQSLALLIALIKNCDNNDARILEKNPKVRGLINNDLWLANRDKPFAIPVPEGNNDIDAKNILGFFHSIHPYITLLEKKYSANSKINSYKNLYTNFLEGKTLPSKISAADIKKIQAAINNLRDLIQKSEELDEKHRRRLLKNLEKLQSELNKKESTIDYFFGQVMFWSVNLSITARMMNENLKPIYDDTQKILKLLWAIYVKSEKLPPSTPFPLLGNKEDAD